MLAWYWITNGQCAKKVHDFFGLNFLVTQLQPLSVGDCLHPRTIWNVIPLACLFTRNLNWRNTLKNWAPSVLVAVGHFMVGLTFHCVLLPFELYICILSLFMRYFLHSLTLTLFSITFPWRLVSITFYWHCRVCGIDFIWFAPFFGYIMCS